MMKKKKRYICPEMDIVYSYDFESELMYGGGGISGGTSSTIITTSSGSSSSASGGGGSSLPSDDEDSERAKGITWGNLWEDDF